MYSAWMWRGHGTFPACARWAHPCTGPVHRPHPCTGPIQAGDPLFVLRYNCHCHLSRSCACSLRLVRGIRGLGYASPTRGALGPTIPHQPPATPVSEAYSPLSYHSVSTLEMLLVLERMKVSWSLRCGCGSLQSETLPTLQKRAKWRIEFTEGRGWQCSSSTECGRSRR